MYHPQNEMFHSQTIPNQSNKYRCFTQAMHLEYYGVSSQGLLCEKKWRCFTNLMHLEYSQDHYTFKIIYVLNILSAYPGLHLEYLQQGARS